MINPEQPVFIGFVGLAGAGKTETARSIVPISSIGSYGDVKNTELGNPFPDIVWDHYWFSLPLYDMYEMKTKTLGVNQADRILYGLHDIVNEVMKQNISYDDMIELVYDIYAFPVKANEDKPRDFLTGVGDMCRKLNNKCFVDFIKYKLYANWRSLQTEYSRGNEDPPLYIPIISDVRMPWEAQMIMDQPNHLLFKFNVCQEVQRRRLVERDGIYMTKEQLTHDTETAMNYIPDEWYDFVIETDDLSVAEQAELVYNSIANIVQQKEEAING